MFQFTTTNIINSNLDSNGVTAKFAGSTTAFTVARVGRFLKSNIVSVHKRAYYAGVKEVASLTVPVITAGLVARLVVDVRLEQQTYSDYANTYLWFEKPIYVEVKATGVAATDAAALVAEVNKIKNRFGISDITASVAGAVITLTATNNNQRFYDAKILKEAPAALENSIIEPVFVDVTAGTFAVDTAGKIGFGDNEWMSRRIFLQTLDHARPFGGQQDERPVLGGNYSEYVLRYSITKDHEDGIWMSNNVSTVTHIFYVKSDLVTAFETALNDDAGLDLDGAGKYTVVA